MFSGRGSSINEAIAGYIAGGGLVMVALLLVTIALWYAIGCRAAILRRGRDNNVRVLVKRVQAGRDIEPSGIVDDAVVRGVALAASRPESLRRRLDQALAEDFSALRKFAVAIGALVAIAPMLGLLGTVIGMIETFASLGDMALFSASGGIAGGIATALFTTQMGLVVAVPGVIAKSVLDRRAQKIEADLVQLKDILVSGPTLAEAA